MGPCWKHYRTFIVNGLTLANTFYILSTVFSCITQYILRREIVTFQNWNQKKTAVTKYHVQHVPRKSRTVVQSFLNSMRLVSANSSIFQLSLFLSIFPSIITAIIAFLKCNLFLPLKRQCLIELLAVQCTKIPMVEEGKAQADKLLRMISYYMMQGKTQHNFSSITGWLYSNVRRTNNANKY